MEICLDGATQKKTDHTHTHEQIFLKQFFQAAKKKSTYPIGADAFKLKIGAGAPIIETRAAVLSSSTRSSLPNHFTKSTPWLLVTLPATWIFGH